MQGIVQQYLAIKYFVKPDNASLLLSDTTSTEGMSRSFDIKTAMNLRKLLVEEFPFGLVVNELYAAYEVSAQRLLVYVLMKCSFLNKLLF